MIEAERQARRASAISRDDLREQLEVLRKKVIDPKVGLYGPGSMLWEVNKHSTVFFGAGRANLLQLAHPWVSQAIDQHSATLTDPLGRLRRTFINVFTMVYGSLDQVLDSSYRVHKIHATVTGRVSEETGIYNKGSKYLANHVGSMIWVHATLWETSVMMYEMFQRPLTAEEKDRYYEETKLFAFLFGIPESALPPTWNEFIAYNRKMWDSPELVVGDVGRQLAGYIFNMKPLLIPVLHRHRLHTAMMLPDRLREEFGLPNKSPRNMRTFERDVAAIKMLMPRMPKHVRYVPAYLEAMDRIEGRKRPDPIVRAANYALLGVPDLVA